MQTIIITTTEVIKELTEAEQGEVIAFRLEGPTRADIDFGSSSPFMKLCFTVTSECTETVKNDAAADTYGFAVTIPDISVLNGMIKVGSSA